MHVARSDGLTGANPAELAVQRRLVESLGGTYHQVVGDDVTGALLEFARAESATQLVLGASRRSWFGRIFGPGIGSRVVRESGDIDVHIITHSAAGTGLGLPSIGSGITTRRRMQGFGLAAILLPLLTLLLVQSRVGLNLVSDVLVTDGVGTIVHCAGSAKGDEVMTRNLVDAASAAGATHLVFISVVGAARVPVVSRLDRAMFGYFAAKRAAELVVERSGLPWSTLRATQFYDLILTTVRAMAKMPVVPTPSGVRFQPIDTHEVATRLVETALSGPAGLVPDIAGPRVYDLKDLLRSYLDATQRHRLVMPVKIPGKSARAIRDGANLAPQHAVGRRTWEDFLTDRTNQHIGSP